MTGYRAFSRMFVKSFPVLSKGFEIETEMTIHAVDKNFLLEEIPVVYRDRPEGSDSKLNTFSDGMKVLKTIATLFREYRPFAFFSLIAAVLWTIHLDFVCPGICGLYSNRTGSEISNFNCVRCDSSFGNVALGLRYYFRCNCKETQTII